MRFPQPTHVEPTACGEATDTPLIQPKQKLYPGRVSTREWRSMAEPQYQQSFKSSYSFATPNG